MAKSNIKILLVDDHAIVREGYKALINSQPQCEIIAEAETGEEAYRYYQQFKPDLVLLDLSLPGSGGLATLAKIKQYSSEAKVLVFSMHQNPVFAVKALKAGAQGYITKSSSPDELLKGIADVMQEKVALSADIAQLIAIKETIGDANISEQLTVREFEIFSMLINGKSKKEIADALNISQKTVSNCHYIIKKKLDVQTDLEMFKVALEMKLISPEDVGATD